MPKPIVDVAIAILIHRGKILVGWREEQQHQGGKHEFPGGRLSRVKRQKKPAAVKFMKKWVLV